VAALYIDQYAFVLLANPLLLYKEEKFEDTKEVNRQSVKASINPVVSEDNIEM
jgi:hypothetical protein